MNPNPEARLISRCKRGDAGAWNELFDQHYAATGRFVFQLSPEFPREDVEEICQEVFLSVAKHLRSFNGHSRLQTWIFRIAINKARDYREKRCAAKRGGGVVPVSLQEADPETGLRLDPPGESPGPDLTLMNAEKFALVGQALDQLGAPHRDMICLRYFGGLSYEEIASELDMNPRTVSSRLSKALDRLAFIMRGILAREISESLRRPAFTSPAACPG